MQNNNNRNSYSSSIFLVGTLFFIFGFITWLNGTLIPFLKTTCQLNNRQASLVTFAFFISYFVMAIPSSAILKKTGFKKGMSLGLIIMAIGCLAFIPAAMQRNYGIFLTGLFIQGLGLSILQTASNPYVTIIGPIESAAKRISLMGICNKIAGVLSPIVVGSILLQNMDSLTAELATSTDLQKNEAILTTLSERIINPYIILALILLVVAFLVRISPLPDVQEEETSDTSKNADDRPLGKHTYLFLGAIAIFMYVGVEVMAGDYIIGYATSLGVSFDDAKYLTSYTLTFMILGYFAGIILTPKIVSQEALLRVFLLLSILLISGVLYATGEVYVPFIYWANYDVDIVFKPLPLSVLMLSMLGFTHAIMWPAIWPMSIKDLGRHTKFGSALLIMGIVGGGIIPFIYSYLGDINKGNLQLGMWVMLPCYLYILFFATIGHKIGWKKQ